MPEEYDWNSFSDLQCLSYLWSAYTNLLFSVNFRRSVSSSVADPCPFWAAQSPAISRFWRLRLLQQQQKSNLFILLFINLIFLIKKVEIKHTGNKFYLKNVIEFNNC